jgi:hypothetical protein
LTCQRAVDDIAQQNRMTGDRSGDLALGERPAQVVQYVLNVPKLCEIPAKVLGVVISADAGVRANIDRLGNRSELVQQAHYDAAYVMTRDLDADVGHATPLGAAPMAARR